MPKLEIVREPSRVLHARAAEISVARIASPEIQTLIRDMRQTLGATPDGVGLAAPQVGRSLRLFLVSEEAKAIDETAKGAKGAPRHGYPRPELGSKAGQANGTKGWEYYAFINPVLKKRSRQKRTMAEGCLSIPGKFGEVSRADKIYLEWYDEHAKKHARGFSKFFARVIQHEADHLEGLLIADRAKKLLDASTGVR